MLVVKCNGDAPLKARTAYAKVLKSGLNEVVEHFLFACLGVNEVFVAFDEIFKLFLIF